MKLEALSGRENYLGLCRVAAHRVEASSPASEGRGTEGSPEGGVVDASDRSHCRCRSNRLGLQEEELVFDMGRGGPDGWMGAGGRKLKRRRASAAMRKCQSPRLASDGRARVRKYSTPIPPPI